MSSWMKGVFSMSEEFYLAKKSECVGATTNEPLEIEGPFYSTKKFKNGNKLSITREFSENGSRTIYKVKFKRRNKKKFIPLSEWVLRRKKEQLFNGHFIYCGAEKLMLIKCDQCQ